MTPLYNIDNVIKIKYADLVNLVSTSSLREGYWYRLIDYNCVVDSTLTQIRALKWRFDIIILATSSNTLCEDCYACKPCYFEDLLNESNIDTIKTAFDNRNLNAWKLKYCITFDKTGHSNDIYSVTPDTGHKGLVYYMKDEYNNETDFDSANILYALWEVVLNLNVAKNTSVMPHMYAFKSLITLLSSSLNSSIFTCSSRGTSYWLYAINTQINSTIAGNPNSSTSNNNKVSLYNVVTGNNNTISRDSTFNIISGNNTIITNNSGGCCLYSNCNISNCTIVVGSDLEANNSIGIIADNSKVNRCLNIVVNKCLGTITNCANVAFFGSNTTLLSNNIANSSIINALGTYNVDQDLSSTFDYLNTAVTNRYILKITIPDSGLDNKYFTSCDLYILGCYVDLVTDNARYTSRGKSNPITLQLNKFVGKLDGVVTYTKRTGSAYGSTVGIYEYNVIWSAPQYLTDSEIANI